MTAQTCPLKSTGPVSHHRPTSTARGGGGERHALSRLGQVRREHEIATDAQRVDTAFRPATGRGPRRAAMGLFGRVASEPCLFEIFHDTFDLHVFDGCVRKQLALAHSDALQAKKVRQKRPPKPRLWILSADRPASVLHGYELRPMAGRRSAGRRGPYHRPPPG